MSTYIIVITVENIGGGTPGNGGKHKHLSVY